MYYDRSGQPMTSEAWGLAFENIGARVIGSDEVLGHKVSTVWLGLDHSFGAGGPPLIFETMVFSGPDTSENDILCWRYATEAEARAGHSKACDWVRNGMK